MSTTWRLCLTSIEHSKVNTSKVVDKYLNKYLNKVDTDNLLTGGMTVQQVREAVELLEPLFAAEGITPSSNVMMQAIMQMHRDAA